MIKVENKETVHFLAKRFMKVNRRRNFIAMVAIVLTTMLFTSVFTASFSMIQSEQASEIRKSSSSSHAILQDVTKEEYAKFLEAVKVSEDVERYGIGTFIGLAANEELQAHQTEVRFADKNMAESFNCLPTQGGLPKAENEVACSTITLDHLGIPHELGKEITLSISVLDQIYERTFKISGFWQGDSIPMAQMVWLSEDYKNQIAPTATRDDLSNGLYEGGNEISVWYHNTWNMEEKTERLTEASRLPDPSVFFQANPAYLLFEEDGFSFSSLFIILLIIMLAGYLIIYNVFNISIHLDISAYGLLKNIGTTGRQLKRIVRRQVWRISTMGILVGLLIGYGIGGLMTPSLMSNMEIREETVVQLSTNPLIFIGAALFSLVTVYISCIQPCKMVDKVSPIEAIKIADSNESGRVQKSNTGVSSTAMAFQNLRRNPGKKVVVMVSLALSLIIMNSVVMLVQGFDFKQYIKVYMASDFAISQIGTNARVSSMDGIGPDVRERLDECADSESNGYIYYSEEKHTMEKEPYDIFEQLFEAKKESMGSHEKERWAEVLSSRTARIHLMGINEGIFEKLEWKEDACSWNDFQNGKYVIVDYPTDWPELQYYAKGDSLNMEYRAGGQKNYEVLGEAQIPYALDYPWADTAYITIMVPESEYMQHTANDYAMRATVDAKPGRETAVAAYIEKNIDGENGNFTVDSILELEKGFQDYINKYYFIGGILTAILAVIGFINFFNASATSILSRKREFALLEVVGMTKKQIRRMLVIEGGLYLMGALVIAVLVILTCSEKILSSTVGLAFFYRMDLTVLPCLQALPLLLLIAYLIPAYNYKAMNRESVVERLRDE